MRADSFGQGSSTSLKAAAFLVCVGFLYCPIVTFAQRAVSTQTSESMVYHGKLLRPNGKVVTGTLSIKAKIYSPEPSLCLLYAEEQTLTVKNGSFAIEIGYPENRLTGADGGAASSFRDVFVNHTGHTITGATCASGTSYTSDFNHDRLLTADFMDGPTLVTLEKVPIKAVPFARQASEISGFGI